MDEPLIVKARRIAFAGASGTGKTTLTEWLKKTYTLPVNPVGSRSVAREMGFASPYDVDVAGRRSEFQMRLMTAKVSWEAERDSFVTDRTTFDNVVYSMMHDARLITTEMLELACKACERYQYVVYCPISVFINLDGDPERLQDLTYQKLYDAAIWGMLQRFRPSGMRLVTLPFSKLEHRYEFLQQLMSD